MVGGSGSGETDTFPRQFQGLLTYSRESWVRATALIWAWTVCPGWSLRAANDFRVMVASKGQPISNLISTNGWADSMGPISTTIASKTFKTLVRKVGGLAIRLTSRARI